MAGSPDHTNCFCIGYCGRNWSYNLINLRVDLTVWGWLKSAWAGIVWAIMFILSIPGRVWRGFCRMMRAIGRWFVAQWRLLLSSPKRFYQSLIRKRDWLLAKVEYLQSESGKWRTAFSIVKMPYTALRACGLNPQAAAALLVAGSTAGTGAIVNETLLQDRSFKNGDPGH